MGCPSNVLVVGKDVMSVCVCVRAPIQGLVMQPFKHKCVRDYITALIIDLVRAGSPVSVCVCVSSSPRACTGVLTSHLSLSVSPHVLVR